MARSSPVLPRKGASPLDFIAKDGLELELGERLALGYQFHIASSREHAIRETVPHYEDNMKMFGELRFVRGRSATSSSRQCAARGRPAS